MRTKIGRASALAALLTALLAATAEAQSEQLRFEVRMRADYSADWLQRSREVGQRCKGWTEGDGYLRGRVRSIDPATIDVEQHGDRWYGSGGSFGPADGSYVSHYAVKVHPVRFQTADCSPCGPLSELGECEPTPRDHDLVGGCRERRSRKAWVTAGIGPKGGAAGSAGIPLPDEFARCGRWPPVLDGSPPSIIQNFRFTWGRVAPQLAKLDVRDRKVLRDTAQEGACGKRRARAEFSLCERWTMELEFRRLPR